MTTVRGQRVIPPQERVERLSIPEPNSGCWIWLGTTDASGREIPYGRLVAGSRTNGSRRSISAHRYSYEAYRGHIPSGLHVCHRCDTPICVNPHHLFLGTRQENTDDRERKGRNRAPIKLTPANVLEIRASGNAIKALARQFGVDRTTIRSVIQRRTWKRIPPPPTPEGN